LEEQLVALGPIPATKPGYLFLRSTGGKRLTPLNLSKPVPWAACPTLPKHGHMFGMVIFVLRDHGKITMPNSW